MYGKPFFVYRICNSEGLWFQATFAADTGTALGMRWYASN